MTNVMGQKRFQYLIAQIDRNAPVYKNNYLFSCKHYIVFGVWIGRKKLKYLHRRKFHIIGFYFFSHFPSENIRPKIFVYGIYSIAYFIEKKQYCICHKRRF